MCFVFPFWFKLFFTQKAGPKAWQWRCPSDDRMIKQQGENEKSNRHFNRWGAGRICFLTGTQAFIFLRDYWYMLHLSIIWVRIPFKWSKTLAITGRVETERPRPVASRNTRGRGAQRNDRGCFGEDVYVNLNIVLHLSMTQKPYKRLNPDVNAQAT